MVKTKEENENLENVIKTVKIEKMDDLNLIGKIAKKQIFLLQYKYKIIIIQIDNMRKLYYKQNKKSNLRY